MIYMKPQEIVKRFGNFKVFLHIGSHFAEERNDYIDAEIQRRVWVDANPLIASELAIKISSENDIDIFMKENCFTKIGYKMWGNDGWGDALYVRET